MLSFKTKRINPRDCSFLNLTLPVRIIVFVPVANIQIIGQHIFRRNLLFRKNITAINNKIFH